MTSSDVLVLGCGYVGLRLVRALVAEGLTVTGATSQESRLAEIEAMGARAVVADILEPASLRPLVERRPAVVFDLTRPQQLSLERYTSWGTRNIANAFRDLPLEALVYLSSTSVYDGRATGWIDEDTAPHPSSAYGAARAECERIYLELYRERKFPVRICRAPSIYGPNRTLRERLEGGAYMRVDDDEQSMSRVHVDDLVVGLIAAWRRGAAGRVYLLCDDEPLTGRQFAELTAELLALPLPPPLAREDIRHDLGDGSFERRNATGRYVNRRMREELGVVLRYPTVREGVPASLKEEGVI
jgi:nucleoside-diphosphate-sugar epimerase